MGIGNLNNKGYFFVFSFKKIRKRIFIKPKVLRILIGGELKEVFFKNILKATLL